VLEWRDATAKDRQALLNFQCVDLANCDFEDEEGWVPTSAPWEFEVQEHVRHELQPPLTAPNFLLLGFDAEGLAAMLELIVTPLDQYCFVASLAVAHRTSGRGLAGEALDQIDGVMAAYRPPPGYYIHANIDPDNTAAMSAFTGRGFAHIGENGRYERWGKTVSS
jgi:hypothetical protein